VARDARVGRHGEGRTRLRQMDEPPGVRLRWPSRPHHGRVLPRRDEPGRAVVRGQHLRFVQAGSRSPPSRAHASLLATSDAGRRDGELQERITSTVAGPSLGPGGLRPADDYTDPHPSPLHPLDATTSCPARSPPRIYPAVDPLSSTSNILAPRWWDRHYRVAARCRASSSASASYRTSLRSSGSTSSAKRTASRSRVPQDPAFLSSRSTSASLHRSEGVTVPIDETSSPSSVGQR